MERQLGYFMNTYYLCLQDGGDDPSRFLDKQISSINTIQEGLVQVWHGIHTWVVHRYSIQTRNLTPQN